MLDATILFILVLILSFLSIMLIMTINIVTEYQRIVLFRLGRVMGIRGPGLILTIPFIDKTVRLDLRTQVINVPKQRLVTLDNVSVDINAVIYFRIVNPKKAVIQVERFDVATTLLAQTILRDLLGKKKLDELLSNREMLDLELQSTLDNYTKPWGVKVSAVNIRDVSLTNDMLRAIAKQAEAERQKRARIIIADGELKASAIMSDAGQVYQENLMALQLRELQTMTEIAREKNLIIVTNERTEIPNIIENKIKPKEVKPVIKQSIKTIPKPSHKKGTVENIVDNLINLKDFKKKSQDEEIVECTV